MKIYELRFEVPLPDGAFAEAEMMMRIKTSVERCLSAWAYVNIPGLKVENRTVQKRKDYTKRKPAIVPPEPVVTAPPVREIAA